MDSVSDSDEAYYVALYAVVSFVLVMLIVLLLYVACTKKYRLNWFEKNLLETADAKELAHRYAKILLVLYRCFKSLGHFMVKIRHLCN